MFSLFRINDPYRLILAFALLLIVRTIFWVMGYPISQIELKFLLLGERLGDGFSMYKEAYDYTAPLSAFVYKWIDIIFGRTRGVHHFLSTILVFVNCSIFNLLLVRNRAYPENNYLPGLFYVLFSLAIPDFFSLTPQLMSSTFILLALNNVFRRVDNMASDELFLFAGLYLGLATLFYFPSIIFFVVFLVSLILFSTAILRRILLYLYGLLVPLLVVYGYFFWTDSQSYLVGSVIGRGLMDVKTFYANYDFLFTVIIIPGGWLLISIIQTLAKGKYGIYESKIMQIMVLYGLAGLLCMVIDVDISINHLILFAPVFAYFMTFYVLTLNKRIFKFVLPGLIVLSLIGVHFYMLISRGDDLPKVSSRSLGFENRELMILGTSLDYYLDQSIASPFIDEKLSKTNFRDLDYYSSATEFYNMIERKKPEVIIDEWGMMDNIFYRFPLLEEKYRKGSNNRYFLISSN